MTDFNQELHTPNLDEVRERIHAQQTESIQLQKEALVANGDLRELVREVTSLRSTAEDREIPDLSEYEDFKGLYSAVRSIFDFRTRPDGSYGERWEAAENAKPFLAACTPELEQRIYETAELFGLTGDTAPEEKEVRAAVILGGGGKSPLDRTQYAADLIREGKLVPEYIVSLGSDRPMDTKRVNGEDEYDRAGDYAEGAQTEYDLMVKAAERVFGVEVSERDVIEWSDPAIMNGVPRVHKIAYIEATESRPPIFIISSAMLTNPFRVTVKNGVEKEVVRDRANTEDTFATLARVIGSDAGSKIVAVTNAHFRPFQGAAAAGQLGEYGLDAEVVGFDPQRYNNEPKRSDELLAEMSTLASSLHKATKN